MDSIQKEKNNRRPFSRVVYLFILIPALSVGFVGYNLYSQQEKVIQKDGEVTTVNVSGDINPKNGYSTGLKFNSLGKKLIETGVMDLEKLEGLYSSKGQSLPETERNLYSGNVDKEIAITRENSTMLLNFFWALGLANNNQILTKGSLTKEGDPGGYASTGGWNLANGPATNHLAKHPIISLTDKQQKLLEEVSANIYRPCCDNPTDFPDCNHGMALLGLLEYMAASNQTEAQMYNAAKYFNAFWFPQNYGHIAAYLKLKNNKSFRKTPAKEILGKEYSSGTGSSDISAWLDNNKVQVIGGSSAGCSL